MKKSLIILFTILIIGCNNKEKYFHPKECDTTRWGNSLTTLIVIGNDTVFYNPIEINYDSNTIIMDLNEIEHDTIIVPHTNVVCNDSTIEIIFKE